MFGIDVDRYRRRRLRTPTGSKKVLSGLSFAMAMWTLMLPSRAMAVVLDSENQLAVTLKDGTALVLLGRAGGLGGRCPDARSLRSHLPQTRYTRAGERLSRSNDFGAPRSAEARRIAAEKRDRDSGCQPGKTFEYYYLPAGLRLATRADGVPQFLFLKYMTDEAKGAGGVSGAVMHFLMQWGLSEAQRVEAERLVNARLKRSDAKVMGPVTVEEDKQSSFSIVSAILSDKTGAASRVVHSGRAARVEGGRMATAAQLDKNAAQLMAATLEKGRSIADLSVVLDFKYPVLLPAARGRVTIDWGKVWQHEKQMREVLERVDSYLWGAYKKEHYKEEVDRVYDELIETKAVDFQFDVLYPSPKIEEIQAKFFEAFMAMVGQQRNQAGVEEDDKGDDAVKKTARWIKKVQYGKVTISLNSRLSIMRTHQLVGNIMEWYDHVRDNPKCVSSVLLNDPFFQTRPINFTLDSAAEDIFKKAFNSVAVEIRKRRSTGRDFHDSLVFDRSSIKKEGITQTVSYARGDDRNASVYEYKVRWSLRGGRRWPPNPRWQQGDWQGVTLPTPVVPRTIEVEGDEEVFKTRKIARATVLIRYRQLGRERQAKVAISPTKGMSGATTIFVDPDLNGFAYQVIYQHKRHGRLAPFEEWSAVASDDYVYVNVPEALTALEDLESEMKLDLLKAGKARARALIKAGKTGVLNVLRDLLGRRGNG